MKLIFGFITLVVLVALTGGIYLFVRKPDDKRADRAWLKGLPAQISGYAKVAREYLSKAFGSKTEESIEQPGTKSNPAV